MNKENFHRGHRERLRKKFIGFGADVLLEHEILELLLFYAIPRMNTNETAHSLIKEFKSSGGVLNAPAAELKKIKGIGKSSADFLNFFADVCSEYNNINKLSDIVETENNISQYFCDYFNGKSPDLCLLANINVRFHVKNQISFSKKSILNNSSEIKNIVEFLLHNDCTDVILGINRPDRTAVPDSTDFALVKILSEKLSVLDITVTDGVICSKNKTFFMRKHCAFSFGD